MTLPPNPALHRSRSDHAVIRVYREALELFH